MNEPKDLYHIAVKVLLRDNDRLLITHDIFKEWDIPGGSIKPDEFEKPLEDIVARKMTKEPGNEVQYSLGRPVAFFRHERLEHSTKQLVRIFAVGYEASYKGGEIKPGDNHDRFEWVNVATFKPEDYFNGGWLKGLQEYLRSQ